MPGTTTGEGRTVRSSSSHPGPTTPWPIFPRNESSADQSSAASSTNTSELPESPGHSQRHNSGTPQGIAGRQRRDRGLPPPGIDDCHLRRTHTARRPEQAAELKGGGRVAVEDLAGGAFG